jgi:hypothetical protein
MRFDARFMHKEPVKGTAEAVFVEERIIELQQVAERRATVPILGNVQFA